MPRLAPIGVPDQTVPEEVGRLTNRHTLSPIHSKQ